MRALECVASAHAAGRTKRCHGSLSGRRRSSGVRGAAHAQSPAPQAAVEVRRWRQQVKRALCFALEQAAARPPLEQQRHLAKVGSLLLAVEAQLAALDLAEDLDRARLHEEHLQAKLALPEDIVARGREAPARPRGRAV